MTILVSTYGGRLSMTIDLGYPGPIDQMPVVVAHGLSFSAALRLRADLTTAIEHAELGRSWAAEPQTRHRKLPRQPPTETPAGDGSGVI